MYKKKIIAEKEEVKKKRPYRRTKLRGFAQRGLPSIDCKEVAAMMAEAFELGRRFGEKTLR